MPSTGMPALLPSSPTTSPAWVPGAAGGGHDAVDPQAHLVGLLHQFLRAGDIAQRADPVGAAAGDHIGLLAGGPQRLALRLGLGVHVRAAGAVLDRRSRTADRAARCRCSGSRGRWCRSGAPAARCTSCRSAPPPRRSGARGWTAPRPGSPDASAPCACASPTSHSSLRTLLPPVATTVQSSRLIQISGPPRWRLRLASFSSGVGVGNRRTRGKRARCMKSPANGADWL